MSAPINYRQEIDTLVSRVTIIEQLMQAFRPMIPIINQIRTDLERLRVDNTTNANNIVLLTEDVGELGRRLVPVEANVADLRQRVNEERHRWTVDKRSRRERSAAPSPPSPIQPSSSHAHTSQHGTSGNNSARRSRAWDGQAHGHYKSQKDSRMPHRYRKQKSRRSSHTKAGPKASFKALNKLGERFMNFVGLRKNVVQRPL